MSTIRCPRGCRWISKRGHLTLEFRNVKIFSGVCDHSDRCEIRACEYFDDTKDGRQRFLEGMCDARSSMEGLIADKNLKLLCALLEIGSLLLSC
ncbi:MAG: hypothetical protein QE493_04190 [Verrucomicrobiae bacterium]|jgi:hypothetical protein|nr:hypothetical protein [Verrucomicrobiae bacterium]